MKIYKQYVKKVNNLIEKYIDSAFKDNPLVKEMVNHTMSGGKRLRSIIPLILSEKMNDKINVDKFAIAIEIFHTCSLIIDDMPCMDNDTLRRGKETLHTKYGETKAQLITFILLQKAFELLVENIDEIKKMNIYSEEQLENIFNKTHRLFINNMGLLGASMGQYIDCSPDNKWVENNEIEEYYKTEKQLLQLLHLKTTTFFEISFIGSYILLGGDETNVSLLKQSVRFFGLAFQLSDDFEDVEQDFKKHKQTKLNPNLVCRYGKKHVEKLYYGSFEKFTDGLNKLNLNHVVFSEIKTYLNKRIK